MRLRFKRTAIISLLVVELEVSQGEPVRLASLVGVNCFNVQDFDYKNKEYYRDLYDKLTAGKRSRRKDRRLIKLRCV